MSGHQGTRRCAARVRLLVSAVAIFFAASALANAATIYWNATLTGWDSTAAWSTAPGAVAPNPASFPGASDIAMFRVSAGTLTTPQTVNLNGTQSVLGLATNASNQATTTILGGGSNQTLNLGASGITHVGGGLTIGSSTAGQQVNVSLQGSQSWSSSTGGTGAVAVQVLNGVSLGVAGANTLTLTGSNTGSAISGAISDGAGTLSLTKSNSTGIWTLSGANSYSGATAVSSGVLRIQSNTALGGTAAGTTVADTARLELAGGITVTGENLVINGTGSNNQGALQNFSGNNTWAGNVTIGLAGTRVGSAAGSLTISGVIDDGANTFDFNVRNAGSGPAAGTEVVVSGANTYGGATNVIVGTLRLGGGDNRLPTGTTLNLGLNGNVDGQFDLNGFNQTVAGLANLGSTGAVSGTVTNSSATASTFTINNSTTQSYSGKFSGSALNVVKTGSGTLNLSGNNTAFAGSVTVSGGQLILVGNSAGSGSAAWNINTSGAELIMDVATNSTVSLGSLSGVAGAVLRKGGFNAGPSTFSIGALGTSTAFAGNITDGVAPGVTTAIEKVGAGTLTLSGNSTYSGATTITTGAINIQSNTALGNTTGGTTVANGAALQLQGGITVTGEALTIGDHGITNTGALRNISGTNTWTGLITMRTGVQSRIHSDAGTLILSGGVTSPSNNTLVLSGAGNGQVTSITNVFQLQKEGAGTWSLTGTSAYTATTVVQGGTLELAAGGQLTGTSSITVGNAVGNGRLLITSNANNTIGASTTDVILGTGGNQGTLDFQSASPVVVTVADQLIVGDSTAGSTGVVNHTGTGTLRVNGTTTIASGASTFGQYNISAGILQANGSGGLIVGANGGSSINPALLSATGTGNATGNGTNNLVVGQNTGSFGRVSLGAGASPTINNFLDIVVGSSGTGELASSGANATATSLRDIQLGATSSGLGTANVSAGTVNAGRDFVVGVSSANANAVTQSGGDVNVGRDLVIAQNAGSRGAYSISAGTLDVVARTIVGGSGGALVTPASLGVSGTGIVTTADLIVGQIAGSFGTVNQSGGTINVTSTSTMIVGDAGTGVENHSGGTTNVAGNLILGNQSTGNGLYNFTQGVSLPAAILNVTGNVSIGAEVTSGTGVFAQSGGTHNVVGNLTIGNSSTPAVQNSYTLSGGTLNFGDRLGGTQFTAAPGNPESTLNIRPDGTFNFNGGTLMNVTNIITDSGSGPGTGVFTQDGGRFVIGVDGGLTPNVGGPPPESQRAMTTIFGDYDQNPGSTLAIDVFGNFVRSRMSGENHGPTGPTANPITTLITDSDLVWVQGDATLDGILQINLNGVTPGAFAWYDVLVADNISITDGKLDLVGLSHWRIIQDPSDPNRQILQVAVPEPASIALWSGAAILLVGVYFVRRRKT